MADFYCYMLECADGSLYTGWTQDLQRRLRQHQSGHGSRYTRSRRPVRLVFVESQPDRRTAMQRERRIKGLTRAQKFDLIRNQTPEDEAILKIEGSHDD